MTQTIIVLLVLLILSSFIGLAKAARIATKEKSIEFYSEKLEQAKKNEASHSVISIAFIIVSAIYIAIIYFSIQSILSFIK